MKTLTLKYYGNIISSKIEDALAKISGSLNFDRADELNLIDREISEIMDNPEDKEKFNKAVEYLQTHRNVKNHEIHLSDKSIIISLE